MNENIWAILLLGQTSTTWHTLINCFNVEIIGFIIGTFHSNYSNNIHDNAINLVGVSDLSGGSEVFIETGAAEGHCVVSGMVSSSCSAIFLIPKRMLILIRRRHIFLAFSMQLNINQAHIGLGFKCQIP